MKKYLNSVFTYIVLIVVSIGVLFPLAWTASTSFKFKRDILTINPSWIPPRPTISNYLNVLFDTSIPRNILVSTIVAVFSVITTVLIGAIAAYGFSRSRYKLKDVLMYLILATMMIPGLSNLVPLYIMFARFGQIDSLRTIVIIYSSWMLPFTIWLLRGFFDSIPKEMEESALIDGCTKFGAFYRIVLPMSFPGISAVSITNAIFAWNEFIVAVVFLNSRFKQTLPVGIQSFQTMAEAEWGNMTAASIIAVLPILIAFLLLRKSFVRGMIEGAVKG
ncbi:MAG: carbohydrate ABC transporter permease [Actinobacteria bacterium]|nr:carbohydrate ABC transporter permease [Actinomycetota bacterium]